MAFNLAIGVDTDQLSSQADVIEGCVNNLRDHINTMGTTFQSMSGHWKGSAYELHAKDFAETLEAAQTILQSLDDYPRKIRTMAGIYEGAEGSNVGLASQLKSEYELR